MAGARIEVGVQRAYRVVWCSSVSADEENVLLDSEAVLEVGDFLSCREVPGLQFRVSGFVLGNPPPPGQMCVLARVSGSERLGSGMTLVPSDET